MRHLALITIGILFCTSASAFAQGRGMSYGKAPISGDTGPKEPEGVKFTQNLGGLIPTDLEFYDHNEKPITLATAMNGKPMIFVLAYYRCPKLCNQVLTGVLDAVKEIRTKDPSFSAGGPFNIVVVSIDPRESAMTIARPKRQAFLEEYYGHKDDVVGWYFLTANHGQGTDVKAADRKIHTLATALGFEYTLRAKNKDYRFDAEQGEWVGKLDDRVLQALPKDYDYQHASGFALVTPEGKISSYLLGINFSARDVRLGLVQASNGTVGTFFEKNVSQYCYVYDDTKGHYKPTLKWTAILAVPVMFGMFFMAYRTVRKGLAEKPLLLPEIPNRENETGGDNLLLKEDLK